MLELTTHLALPPINAELDTIHAIRLCATHVLPMAHSAGHTTASGGVTIQGGDDIVLGTPRRAVSAGNECKRRVIERRKSQRSHNHS